MPSEVGGPSSTPGFYPRSLGIAPNDARERSNLLLRLLAEASGHLLVARDGDSIVRGVYERIAPALELHAYFNFMVNEAGDALCLASCAGIPVEEARAISRLEFGQAVCGTVAQSRWPMVATSIQESDDPKVQLVRGYGIRAYACNPLMAGDRLLGTLSFGTRSRDRFADDELEFFRTVAQYVAVTEERLRMTAALRQQAALLDLAQDGIITTSLDGAVQFWNRGAERLYGWTASQARGRNYAELLGAKLPRPFEEIARALSARPVWETELAQTRRDGREARVWSRWAAREDAGGRQTGFLILEHDTGERNRMEEELRQSQKLESLGLLAGGIAHDFNNLLTGILGNASLLEGLVPAEAAEQLANVLNGAEQAAQLTRQLLAYAGKGRAVAEDIDLAALLRDTVSIFRVSVPKTTEVCLNLAPELPAIHADPGQIQQVLMNLVINAREAVGSREGGSIAIGTGAERIGGAAELAPGEYVKVTVSDNGCGMDRQTAARIFDPFFTTKPKGRGLGLSAVAGIMRSCRGRIMVDSRPGEGTTFTLLFPAVARAAESAQPAVEAPLPTGGTVLVVDDEASVRAFAKSALERAGYQVLLAANGREAVEVAVSGARIDLVLLDMVMPVMGGAETLARLREHCPGVKVLVTSGYPADEVQRLCSGAAANGFLEKPFRPRMLHAKVAAALGG